MPRYVLRRLLQALPLLFILSVVLFVLMQNIGDPLATTGGRTVTRSEDRKRLARQLGLDKPIVVQYIYWLVGNDWTKVDLDGDGIPETWGTRKGILRGDFGTSLLQTGRPALAVIGDRLPNTLLLMVSAEIVIIVGALLIGVYSALRQYSWIDNLVTSISFIGYSMPIFFIAFGCIEIFAVQFKAWHLPYLPTGADIWSFTDPYQLARHMILPVFCLVCIQTAGYSRYLRSSILEVLGMDYVRTAHAKGLTNRTVLFKHALRNAILPFVTIIGLDIPFLLGGALVTESIFAWPGMGRLFWEYAERGDYPVVLGVLLVTSTAVVFFTIIVDLIYTVVDPRIRLS